MSSRSRDGATAREVLLKRRISRTLTTAAAVGASTTTYRVKMPFMWNIFYLRLLPQFLWEKEGGSNVENYLIHRRRHSRHHTIVFLHCCKPPSKQRVRSSGSGKEEWSSHREIKKRGKSHTIDDYEGGVNCQRALLANATCLGSITYFSLIGQ